MSSQVYFGNATKQLWIKAPTSGMSASQQGWSVETPLLNGMTSVRRSKAAHRRFSPSWVGPANATDLSDSLNTIKDFADGLYGDGPFYWLDPYAAKTNVLPENWAAPMLTEKDWPSIASGLIPTFTAATVANNFPIKYATYTTTGEYASTKKLILIIPNGYKLAFGWHGPSTGATTGVRIVPYKRTDGTADTALNPTKITAGGTTRTNTIISGTAYSRVEIFLATGSSATLNITAMIAQILPTGDGVASGGFISGRGTTGIEFNTRPKIEYYSANINDGQIGLAVDWIEV
jgi:hypothetical protein